MRLLTIGDLHGCSRALDTLLATIELQPDDRLITLGDYVDRGPDSRGVLERLIALADAGWLAAALRGNHDMMMLGARAGALQEIGWQQCGGDATLDSYGRIEGVPDEHWDFLENRCLDWYETDRHLFVHANALPNLALEDQPLSVLHWEKLTAPRAHQSGKVLVCGHTQQKSGLPLALGHTVCLDTYVYGSGWLTCLDVRTGRFWQANQKGERRSGDLGDLGALRGTDY